MRKSIPIVVLVAMLFPFSVKGQKMDSTSRHLSERKINDSVNLSVIRAFSGTSAKSADFIPLGYATTSILRPIDGAVTGVQMTNGGGQPGASPEMIIRGISNFYGSDNPLIVLDGAPYNGNIAALNTQDIKTITVLKDAMATLPYGSRGGNGVVEIVTKQGKASGNGRLNIDVRFGTVTRGIPDYDVLTSEKDYYETMYEARKNSGYTRNQLLQSFEGYNSYNMPLADLFDANGKINPAASLKYSDSWGKQLLRTGFKHDYNVSYSDRTAKSELYFGTGYLNEQGYIRGSGLERFNITFNVATTLSPWLKAGLNTMASLAKSRYNETSGQDNAVDLVRKMPPIYPVFFYDASGQRRTDPLTGQDQYDFGSLTNFPQSSMGDRDYAPGENRVSALTTDKVYTNSLNYNINPYVEGTILKQFKVRVAAYYNTISSKDVLQKPLGPISANTNADASIYTINQSVTWHPDWGNHHINVVLANEFYKLSSQYERIITNQQDITSTEGATDNNSLSGYYANTQYDYKSRYFISAGFRHDNTSNLAPGLRGNNFSAFSIGYAITEEQFLKDNPWLNLLKFRLTYGTQGSFGLPTRVYPYQSLDYIDTSSIYPQVTAAKQHQTSIGLDATLFNRVAATIGLYSRISPTNIYGTEIKVKNSGVELSLGADIIRQYKSAWSVHLNLTHNSNTLLNLPNGSSSIYLDHYVLREGNGLFAINVPEFAGVDPLNGKTLYYKYDSLGQKKTTSDYQSVKAPDYKLVGSVFPKVYGSLTNSVSWNRFDFSLRVNFSIGGKYYDYAYQDLMGSGADGTNWHTDILNRWTPQNPSSDIPAVDINEPTQVSSRFVTDASYLSIKNMYLAYNLISSKRKKTSLKALSIYLTADNIWIFTARKGMDPQASFDGTPVNNYPSARTIMLGLHVGI